MTYKPITEVDHENNIVLNFGKHSFDFFLPDTFNLSENDIADSTTYINSEYKSTLTIYFYTLEAGTKIYETNKNMILSTEMVQKLDTVKQDNASWNTYRHISKSGNLFQAIGIKYMGDSSLLYEFVCPNSNSETLYKMFKEAIISAKRID